MDRNSQILITAVERYINDLQYIAKENKHSLNNMMNFLIINYLYSWTYQLEESDKIFELLSKKAENLIFKDENLSHYITDQKITMDVYKDGQYPKHFDFNTGRSNKYTYVNVPQPFESSGLMFDEANCKTID